MSLRHWMVAVLLSQAFGMAHATGKPTDGIYNVMETDRQACSTGAGAVVEVHAHPQRALILASGVLPITGTGYAVDFSAIPQYRAWTAVTRFHADDRGVDDSYVLFTASGLTPFTAAYVVTRLPEPLRGQPDSAMRNVLEMQQANAEGNKLSFIHATTPFGEGVEMITGGRLGSACFPTARFVYANAPEQAAVGISRFVIRGDDLIEYSLSLPIAPDIPQPQMIALAQQAMEAFVHGLKAIVPR